MPGAATPRTLCRNIELKARCMDLDRARALVLSLELRGQHRMLQTDTYFNVPHGRLKLREIDGCTAELIWYDRPDQPFARDSIYTIASVNDPAAMLRVLTRACGVRVRVSKRREVYLHRNVRIHLDQVDGLGDFLEFEAVIEHLDDEAPSRQMLGDLRAMLGIDDVHICSQSYADMQIQL